MSAPLRRRGQVDGAVSVGFTDGRWLTESDLELLTAFADLAGIACRNADDHAAAQRAASRDSLTGCLNHASFQERLREEIARSERGADAFTLAMLDLENFKDGQRPLRPPERGHRAAHRRRDPEELHARAGQGRPLRWRRVRSAAARHPRNDSEPLVGRLLSRLRRVSAPGGGTVGPTRPAERRPGEGPITVIERADEFLLSVKREHHADDRRGAGAAAGAANGIHDERADSRRRRMAVASRVGAKLSRMLEVDVAQATTRRTDRQPRLRLRGDHARERRRPTAAGGRRRGPARSVSTWAWGETQDEGAVGRCLRERRPARWRPG